MKIIPGFMTKRRRGSALTWTVNSSTGIGTSYSIGGLDFDGTTWVLTVRSGASSRTYHTTDPTGSWTEGSSLVGTSTKSVWKGSTYWAAIVTYKIYTATSATGTWTQRSPGGSDSFNDVTYSTDLSLWITAGLDGSLYTASDPTSTWTSRSNSFGTDTIYAVGAGNSLAVIGGSGGGLDTSADGTTWTSRTSSFGTNAVVCAAYGNSIWVFGGTGSKLATSTDPTSSITQNANTPTWASGVYGLHYGNELWCSVGAGGTIATATNPTGSWDANTSGTTNNLYKVVKGSSYWVAVGDAGTIITAPV